MRLRLLPPAARVATPMMADCSHSVNIICEETVLQSFVSHLSAALRREGISVFVDACGLQEIRSFSVEQKNQAALTDGARVSVVVISNAVELDNDPWVPKFLEVIKAWRNNGHVVVPVFYGLDPLIQVYGWANTWLEFEKLTSHHSRISSNKVLTDSELVEEIVRDVYGKLYPTERVGIYTRLLEIEELLYKQHSRDVRSIGIWGMPGIGKTTLAKAVFNHMSTDYDASCFIENFDKAFHKEGLHGLFKERIGKLLMEEFDIKSLCIMRPSLHRDKLYDKRILLVLDGVCDSLAAESFLKRLDWFGPGSLIIITSIDKQVFAFCQIYHIYKVQGLNTHEALQLFSQSAFGRNEPEKNDMELSMKVIDYVNGNPLALSIFGRELVGKKSEMETAFFELKQCLPLKIQDVLKNAYSALSDDEKNIVLDIAFFFKGETVSYVVQMLEGCHYFPRVAIDVLVDKCVLTISESTVQMNNLIQDSCQEIFNGETESCTRMWEPSRIRYLLEYDELEASGETNATPKCGLVAEHIVSIILDTSNLKFDVKHDAFKNMFNLKFLKIYSSCSRNNSGLKFPKGLDSLPCELRLLHWESYPMQSLPQDFDCRHLVELSMPYSQLHKLGARIKDLKMLKRLILCHSLQLVECDILIYAQNIELIDLQGCTGLQRFPDTSQLQNLRVVNLSGCTGIQFFSGVPPNIEELHLQGTHIREIPISNATFSPKVKLDRKKLLNLLENFSDVEHIDLECVTNLAKVTSYNQGMSKLVCLNMKYCSHLRSLPDMVSLESLEVLYLSGCSELEEIKDFPRNLRKLYLGGTAIVELPQLPKSLEFLNAHGCKHLKSINLDFEQLPRHFIFSNCFKLSSQVNAKLLEKGLVPSLARAKEEELIKAPEAIICIPIDERQRSSFHLQAGPNAMQDLRPWMRKPISGFSMSVVVSFQDDYHNDVGLRIRCVATWKTRNNRPDRIIQRYFQCWAPTEAPKVEEDHIFVFYDTKLHPSDGEENHINLWAHEVKFEFHTVSGENNPLGASCKVTECGVEVITAPSGDTINIIEEEDTQPRKSVETINIIEEEDTLPTKPEETINIIEEEDTLPTKPEETNRSLSSSEPQNISSMPSKGEKEECAYFIRTGHCGYGSACRYHHPVSPAVQAPSVPPTQQYGVVLPRPQLLPSSYVPSPYVYGPMVLRPGMAPFSGWNPNPPSMGTSSVYGIPSLSPVAAFRSYPSSTDISNKEQTFPQRPEQPECQYFMRTGNCKFGSSCKFHHPMKAASPKAIGLPLRPGVAPCTHFAKHGICKFGPACKFDHSMGSSSLRHNPSTSSLTDMPVAPYPTGSSPLGKLAPSSYSSDQSTEILSSSSIKPITTTGGSETVGSGAVADSDNFFVWGGKKFSM